MVREMALRRLRGLMVFALASAVVVFGLVAVVAVALVRWLW
jgi:hypothetical protein